MSPSVQVRRVTGNANLAAATALLTQFFAEDGFTTAAATIAANTRTLAQLETCGLFVALAGDEAVGVATVSLEFGIEYGWSAEMGDLYVVPRHRGGGVSRKLIEAVEAFLREKGAAGYQVTVAPHGHEAMLDAFYSKLGFADEGRLLRFKTLAAGEQK